MRLSIYTRNIGSFIIAAVPIMEYKLKLYPVVLAESSTGVLIERVAWKSSIGGCAVGREWLGFGGLRGATRSSKGKYTY